MDRWIERKTSYDEDEMVRVTCFSSLRWKAQKQSGEREGEEKEGERETEYWHRQKNSFSCVVRQCKYSSCTLMK